MAYKVLLCRVLRQGLYPSCREIPLGPLGFLRPRSLNSRNLQSEDCCNDGIPHRRFPCTSTTTDGVEP